MSTLMFWNKQNSANQNNDAKNAKNGRNWLHAPDVLVNGHVAYLVKFLGNTQVEQAKGIEVVKEAIRKLQFTQQIKKAEGVKSKKVEITVSVDGVAIQEPRTQTILHQFPLHKISYCADEKGVKKFFSFIAKTGNTPMPNGETTTLSTEEAHECFVFISNKLASDITLTIGQAFDLAYRRYMNDSGKSIEVGKLQLHTRQLENTVTAYRQRLRDLSEIVSKSDLDRLLIRLGLRDILEVPQENGIDNHVASINGSKTPDLGIDVSSPNNDDQLLIETSTKHFAPIVPPRNLQNQINSTLEAFKPSVGTKLEGLLINSDSDSDFDPRADENDTNHKITNDLFGFEPPKQTLGQQLFSTNNMNGNSMNNHNNMINTNNIINTNGYTNGNGVAKSPPPLLAPPPKSVANRRTSNQQIISNNNIDSSPNKDLFGSMPFSLQSNVFDGDSSEPISVLFTSTSFTGIETGDAFNQFSSPFAMNPSALESVAFKNSFDNVFNDSLMQKGNGKLANPFLTTPTKLPSLNTLKVESSQGTKVNSFENLSFTRTPNLANYDITLNSPPIILVQEKSPKNEINNDLFKDFATKAFSDFQKDDKKLKNFRTSEFCNQLTEKSMSPTFANHSSSKNNMKKDTFNADDFTLESLDPLK